MGYDAWDELDEMIERKDYWDMLMPSHFARTSPELEELAREIGRRRAGQDASPLAFLQDVMASVYRSFTYTKKSTAVDSPIEVALKSRQGVCQDFAHIMITLVRHAGNSVPLCERISVSRARAIRIVRRMARRTPGWKRLCPGSAGWDSIRRII